jgi:NAD(P)-dependent dehydrogenase (short-subunit alcohol dehydrogenase family)
MPRRRPAGILRPVVLVTGASSGIGAATATALARIGHTVIGASRRGTAPPGVHGLAMDVTDDDAVAAGLERVLGEHGRLDALVAGAGYGLSGPVETTPLDAARAQLETNFWGTVRVTRAALPALRAGPHGLVVVLSSLAGIFGIPFQAYYTASKFALEGWAEALAYEVEPLGVHVTLVEPGNIRTGFTDARRDAGEDAGSPYAAAHRGAVGIMVRDEREAAGPDVVARVIARAVTAGRPPRRATAGSLDERYAVLMRRLLPARAFERLGRRAMLER